MTMATNEATVTELPDGRIWYKLPDEPFDGEVLYAQETYGNDVVITQNDCELSIASFLGMVDTVAAFVECKYFPPKLMERSARSLADTLKHIFPKSLVFVQVYRGLNT